MNGYYCWNRQLQDAFGRGHTRLKMPSVRHFLWFEIPHQQQNEKSIFHFLSVSQSYLPPKSLLPHTLLATTIVGKLQAWLIISVKVHNKKEIRETELCQKKDGARTMGVVIFVKHSWRRIRKPLQSNNQDLGVALALYIVYPAILWLLIDKFHGKCGFETYEIKQEAIAANNAVFL